MNHIGKTKEEEEKQNEKKRERKENKQKETLQNIYSENLSINSSGKSVNILTDWKWEYRMVKSVWHSERFIWRMCTTLKAYLETDFGESLQVWS